MNQPLRFKPDQLTVSRLHNDLSDHSMLELIRLKDLFARQLPKMPKEYIVRVLFNEHHESLVASHSGTLIAGICFRVFDKRGLVEVVFLAVSSENQVAGIGSHLMNCFKTYMQQRGIRLLMTYADNQAIGFFRKQGFSRNISTPPAIWKGCVKDYQGGTLMECIINLNVDYHRLRESLLRQRDSLIEQIKQNSISQVRFAKLNSLPFKEFVRQGPNGVLTRYPIDPMLIPGVAESGWTWEEHDALISRPILPLRLKLLQFLQTIERHPSSWLFREPVSSEDVPDYLEVVKSPIDLSEIRRKVNCEEYKSTLNFQADIRLMFSNCRRFNPPDSVYYQAASKLQAYLQSFLDILCRGSEGKLGR